MTNITSELIAININCRQQLMRAFDRDKSVREVMETWKEVPPANRVNLASCLCVMVGQLSREKQLLERMLEQCQSQLLDRPST